MLTFDALKEAVRRDAAIRGRATLQPVGGPGDKVFPPTHAVDERRLRQEERVGAKYARETRRIGDHTVECVLLDSVQSQANRMEEALGSLWRDKVIPLPVIVVDFADKFPDLGAISSLTAPHRIADALLRDCLLDGTLFRRSPLGRSFTDASIRNAASLFHVCPTALVFGLWDSTGPRGGLGFKLARNLTSEIVAIDVAMGTRSESRIDPAGILKKPITVYKAESNEEQWTVDEARAKKDDGKPVPYGKKDKAGTATAINHSNIPPTLGVLAGGITFQHAIHTVVLSLAGVRRLSVGSPDDDAAIHTVIAALGLLAATASTDRGYDLRSRCQLAPEPGKALSFERIAKDGTASPFSLDLAAAKMLYLQAVEALPNHLRWKNGPGEPLAQLTPTPKLVRLIEESRKLAVAGESEDED